MECADTAQRRRRFSCRRSRPWDLDIREGAGLKQLGFRLRPSTSSGLPRRRWRAPREAKAVTPLRSVTALQSAFGALTAYGPAAGPRPRRRGRRNSGHVPPAGRRGLPPNGARGAPFCPVFLGIPPNERKSTNCLASVGWRSLNYSVGECDGPGLGCRS